MKKTYFFYYDDDIIDGLDIPEEEIFKAKILLVKNVVFGRTNRLQELILNYSSPILEKETKLIAEANAVNTRKANIKRIMFNKKEEEKKKEKLKRLKELHKRKKNRERLVRKDNVIKALSGEEALKKTAGIDLALAIVDVMMPGYRDWETDRKSTRLNSSHITRSRMPSSA